MSYLANDLILGHGFVVADLCASETATKQGIDNRIPMALKNNVLQLVALLGAIEQFLGHKLLINSAYRCPQLNKAVGGAAGSKHLIGLAADIVCPEFGAALTLAKHIAQSCIAFEQVLLEFGSWVHVVAPEKQTQHCPKREVLSLTQDGYRNGIVLN